MEFTEIYRRLRENPLLRNAEFLIVAVLVYLIGKTNIKQIADITGRPYTSVYYTVKKLCELGVLEKVVVFEKNSYKVEQCYKLTDQGVKMLLEALEVLQKLGNIINEKSSGRRLTSMSVSQVESLSRGRI